MILPEKCAKKRRRLSTNRFDFSKVSKGSSVPSIVFLSVRRQLRYTS
jgi:hypothetical protein